MSNEKEKNKQHRKNGGRIRLIASDKIHQFQYQGCCKITINYVQSMLFIEPIIEEFKLISTTLKSKFYVKKNILFVVAENVFILVFNNEIKCKKVCDLIYQKRAKEEITNEEIYQRFLFPIFNGAIKNKNSSVSKLLIKWMNKLEKKDKEFFIEILKNDNIFQHIYTNGETPVKADVEKNDEIGVGIRRKRRFCKANTGETTNEKSTNDDKEKKLKNFVKSNCDYKIVNINGENRLLKRLLIFVSSGKNFCYEYSQNPFKPNVFRCIGCRNIKKNVYAKIDQNETLYLQNKKHGCTKIKYSDEKYFDLQIVEKPNYEILENCNTKTGKMLIIFNTNDRSQCHEFRWENATKSFLCLSCRMNVKVKTFLKGKEYVELPQLKHECPFRPYDREKYFKFNNFVLAPNFEHRTEMVGEKEKKRIIIFDQNDKTKCYIYAFHSKSKLYICRKCEEKRLQVSAKLCQNSDGESYVITSNTKHVCEMVKYVLQNNDKIILHPPNFTVISSGKQKVFVFDQKNKTLGYIFTHLANNRYQCNGCNYFLRKNIKKNDLKSPGNFYICLCKNEDGEYYVQMKCNQKHLCQPRKYQPEKFEIIQPTENYFYYRNKLFPKSVNLAIFLPNDKNLCYTFNYSRSGNYFQCLKCVKVDKWYSISPPKKDENGKEYFMHNPSKHSCKPIKVSSIQTSNFQKVERKDITFEGESKKEMKIDEKRIIKLPNFEFRPNKFGEPEGKIVIFDSKDKSFCYEYYYKSREKIFCCTKCALKKLHVSAKIHIDEKSNEKFLELHKNDHICEPIKDVFAEKVIEASKFMFLNRDDKTKPTKIIVFTCEKKEFYYEFRYRPSENIYLCGACRDLKKRVCVKSYKKENGEEYLMTLKNDKHVCEPKKYDPKNFEPKTLPKSMFLFYQNNRFEKNKRLIVFPSEKKDFVYEYSWQKTIYRCIDCFKQNKSVTAKLFDENEKFVELSKVEHICKPKKYDQQKFQSPKTVSKSMFELYQNTNGEANKKLVVFTSEKKDFVFEYYWYTASFYCSGCRKQKKSVSAKLLGEENEKFIELSKVEHICKPKKFDPKNYKK